MDVHTPRIRSKNMSAIKNRDTLPELAVRKGLFNLGYRYRVNVKALTGTPDIVFPGRSALIFVHGCFWHGHGCALFKWPKTRRKFWADKIQKNVHKDVVNIEKLEKSWRIGIVWECSLKAKDGLGKTRVIARLQAWLDSEDRFIQIP